MKSTVVLKDINSNLIEEAIIVFKENVRIREKQLIERKKEEKGKKENSDETKDSNMEKIAIAEAKNVILNYLEECEKEKKSVLQKRRMETLKVLNIFLIVLLIIATIF